MVEKIRPPVTWWLMRGGRRPDDLSGSTDTRINSVFAHVYCMPITAGSVSARATVLVRLRPVWV
jgi:hypothetical protein